MNEFGAVVCLFSQYHPEKTTIELQVYDTNFNTRFRKTLTGLHTVALLDQWDIIMSGGQGGVYYRIDKKGDMSLLLDKYDKDDFIRNGMAFKCFSNDSERAIMLDGGDLYIVSIKTGRLINTIALNTFATWDIKIKNNFIYFLRSAEFSIYDLNGNLLSKKCIPDLNVVNTFEIVDRNQVYFQYNYSNRFFVI